VLSPSDTAYRVLTASASAHELDNAFTPDLVELAFAERHTRRPASLVGLLLLLKTFQRIGYFVPLSDIPASVVRQVSRVAGFANVPGELSGYDSSTTRREHMALVRSYIGVTAFDRDAQKLMLKACVEAARSREDLADIINSAIEELLRNYRELPAFSTLLRGARRARSTVNLGYYGRIARSFDEVAKKRFASLLERKAQDRRTDWDALKMEPGRPTVKRIRRFLQHLDWLKELAAGLNPFSEIPVVKLQRFAAEARALNAARMGEVMENKRHALAAALLDRQLRRAFDDGGDMVIRVVQKMHNTAKELLEAKRVVYLQQATELVTTLREVALAYSQNAPAEERLNAIGAGLGADPEKVVKRCDEHSALVGGDHLRFLPDAFRHPRTALLLLLEKLEIASTTSDKRLENAISFIVAHKARPTGALAVARQERAKDGSLQHVPILDLSFVPDRWWRLVTGLKNRDVVPTHVDHRLLELCVITEVANELKSCDLCLPRGDKFRDYRNQLVSPEQYEREVPIYSERMGIAVTGPEFVANLQRELEEMAQKADAGFPDNKHLRIENGEPVLTAAGARPDPAGLREFESLLKRHMEPVEILDALVDTEHWLNWTRFFGPLSGLDTKLKNARVRYLLTTFCFGSAMGPAQTARCVVGANRFQLAFINQRHVTEANLNDAITLVINAYVQFPLQRLWGLGRSASADGMKWDLYPQNLVAEYHIRYGGYGGIGYYLLSDCYIALVSRFTMRCRIRF